MQLFLLVALGGAIGASLRFFVVQYLTSVTPDAVYVPWATLTVNVIGGFLMGIAFVIINQRFGGSPQWRAFVATGVLGGFTTFSAYSLDMMNLLTFDGASVRFWAYTVGSVIGAFVSLAAGMWLARAVLT